MSRYLVIPIKEKRVIDNECIEAIILAPTERQARKHVKAFEKDPRFVGFLMRPIDTNFDYAGR